MFASEESEVLAIRMVGRARIRLARRAQRHLSRNLCGTNLIAGYPDQLLLLDRVQHTVFE